MTTRGLELCDRHIREDNIRAGKFADEAIAIDDKYVHAWLLRGWVHWVDALWSWQPDSVALLHKASAAQSKAYEVSPENPHALYGASMMRYSQGRYAEAIEYCERSMALAPNHYNVVFHLAYILMLGGKSKEATVYFDQAMRLSPFYPPWFISWKGINLLLLGDTPEAVRLCKIALSMEPDSALSRMLLLIAMTFDGNVENTKSLVDEIHNIEPTVSIKNFLKVAFNHVDETLHQRVLENMLSIGLR